MLAVLLALVVLRLWLSGHLELVADEAYYWMWARALGWGYFDHPPMVAWWIAAGRALFGDTEFGVRVMGVLATLPLTWLVYRIAVELFGDQRLGLIAALWMQATLFVAVDGLVMTPDTPLMLFSALAIFALTRVARTGDGHWWYLVGIAAGLALLSKYTGFYIGLGIVLWLALTPSMRHWFGRFELYAGGALAMLVFAPNLIWNAANGWVTFTRQFGRLSQDRFAPYFVIDFLGGQIGLLTPLIFAFAATGMVIAVRRAFTKRDWTWTLISAMTVPLLLTLFKHGLQNRVEGNWTAMIIPLAVIVGVKISYEESDGGWRRKLRLISRRFALPVGLFISLAVYAQAAFDLAPDFGISDPTSRMKGWRELANDVDSAAEDLGADYIATTSYTLTSLLAFYGDPTRPVVQLNQRYRYQPLATPPSDELFDGPGLYVAKVRSDKSDRIAGLLELVEPGGPLVRRRPGGLIEELSIYVIGKPRTQPPFSDDL